MDDEVRNIIASAFLRYEAEDEPILLPNEEAERLVKSLADAGYEIVKRPSS